MTASLAARPIRPRARSRISVAALLVNVMAKIFLAATPDWIKRPILWVMTRVLPDPAPASTRQGPCMKFTASCWARFRPVVGAGDDMEMVDAKRVMIQSHSPHNLACQLE